MRIRVSFPDVKTYNTLLNEYCKNLKMIMAIEPELFYKMTKKLPHRRDSSLFQAYKCMRLELARNLFNEVTVIGLQHNVRSYIMMISGSIQEGRLSETKELFNQTDERGCQADSGTHNMFIHRSLRNKDY
ncbi:hypothetical protein OSB04_000602 [Centaurea solstitialis]|uniref:Uncharacterized protein n=1 Tax=Centaurea solstitialis TaxID=347529 RepID=A0AA38WUL8_9ASTR|nr:hypothetical protein OSB04_000602 [Centaurea solstitialis]